MASNRLPDAPAQLFTLADDMVDGLSAHETEVGVKQNTAAAVGADLAAARAAQDAFQTVRSGKPALSAAATVADSNGKAFLAGASDVLGKFLGGQWSQAWLATGFPHQSTGVPRAVGERESLLGNLQTYFTAHPEHEVPVAPFNVTAARAGELFTALSTARNNLALAARTTSAEARAARDAAMTTLRARMGGLVAELGQLLKPEDPRWYLFGLNRPGDPETPGAPDGLILTPGAAGSGTVYADWADARRAGATGCSCRWSAWTRISARRRRCRRATPRSPACRAEKRCACACSPPTTPGRASRAGRPRRWRREGRARRGAQDSRRSAIAQQRASRWPLDATPVA